MTDTLPAFLSPTSPSVTPADEALLEKARLISEQFIVRFYGHDMRWCLAQCHDDISYFGTTRSGFALGYEQFHDLFLNGLTAFNPSLVLSLDITPSLLPGNQTVLVLARFHLLSNPSLTHVHALNRNATLVWVVTEEGLRLRHMQTSIPYSGEVDNDNLVDVTRDTRLYAQTVIEQLVRKSSMAFTDVAGTLHYLSPHEVRYLEADRQRTVIHCLNRTVVVRRGFGDMLETLSNSLVKIHRSYAINPYYLRMVTRETAVLDDGTQVPLPKRHARETRKMLAGMLEVAKTPRVFFDTALDKTGQGRIAPEDQALDITDLLPDRG